MLLMIDNYDSFTYNLVQYLGELGAEVCVYRNDQITIEQIGSMDLSHIMISPGPCTPNEAGISVQVVKEFGDSIPILGVCLGHQSVGRAFDSNIVHAPALMHGKTSMIYHDGKGIFNGLQTPFQATRYHSLVIDPDSLSDCMAVTAWTKDKEIMGIQHIEHPIFGVQFHPESILTQHGHDLLRNFLTNSEI